MAAGVGPGSANFGTTFGARLIPSRMAGGLHYVPSQGKTVRFVGPQKPFGGSWRVIGRYQRAANLGVAVPEHPYKNFDDDPGLAEKTGSRIVCFCCLDFCPYWAWRRGGAHPGTATLVQRRLRTS